MTVEQQNRRDVVDNVVTHFQSHQHVWGGIEPVCETVNALLSTQQGVELSSLVQADGTTSSTVAKNLALDLGARKAYTMCRRICGWARKNGHAEVLGAIDFSVSDLKYGAEAGRVERMKLVVQYATAHKNGLAAYKVNDAAIDDLQTALNTAEVLRKGRNEKMNHRIYSTANIDEQLARAAHLMEILDDEVEGLIEDHQFTETYFIARRKTDRRATRAGATSENEAPGA